MKAGELTPGQTQPFHEARAEAVGQATLCLGASGPNCSSVSGRFSALQVAGRWGRSFGACDGWRAGHQEVISLKCRIGALLDALKMIGVMGACTVLADLCQEGQLVLESLSPTRRHAGTWEYLRCWLHPLTLRLSSKRV